jgi:hypothetical protein
LSALIKPMKAVFEQEYVKRITGPNVKTGSHKKFGQLAQALIEDIAELQGRVNGPFAAGDDLVRVDGGVPPGGRRCIRRWRRSRRA